jgi:hypothetical protein
MALWGSSFSGGHVLVTASEFEAAVKAYPLSTHSLTLTHSLTVCARVDAFRSGNSRCSLRVRTMADYILNQRPEHVNRTKPQLKAVFSQVPHLDPYAVIPTLNLLQVARVRSPPIC